MRQLNEDFIESTKRTTEEINTLLDKLKEPMPDIETHHMRPLPTAWWEQAQGSNRSGSEFQPLSRHHTNVTQQINVQTRIGEAKPVATVQGVEAPRRRAEELQRLSYEVTLPGRPSNPQPMVVERERRQLQFMRDLRKLSLFVSGKQWTVTWDYSIEHSVASVAIFNPTKHTGQYMKQCTNPVTEKSRLRKNPHRFDTVTQAYIKVGNLFLTIEMGIVEDWEGPTMILGRDFEGFVKSIDLHREEVTLFDPRDYHSGAAVIYTPRLTAREI